MGNLFSSKEDTELKKEMLKTMKKSNDIQQEKLDIKKKEMDNQQARHLAQIEVVNGAVKCGQVDKIREITFSLTVLETVHGQGEGNCDKALKAITSSLPKHPVSDAGMTEISERGEEFNYEQTCQLSRLKLPNK